MAARFFFDTFDGEHTIDEDGAELADMEDAMREAARFAGGLLRDDPAKLWSSNTWFIRVRDERNHLLFEVNILGSVAAPTKAVAVG